jgi:hypothetical protein
MLMYPWWEQEKQTAWVRACERVKPCAETIDRWRKDRNFEVWMCITGSAAHIEAEERARGGMWHAERVEPEYIRLREAFETAQREVQTEREANHAAHQRRTLALRMERAMKKRKAEATASTADREPTPPCEVSIEAPGFFGR